MKASEALTAIFIGTMVLLLGGPALFAGFALALVIVDERRERR